MGSLKKIVKIFDGYNVAVVGAKGRGKDMLSANVVVRRNTPYFSNIDYTDDDNYFPFDANMFDINNDFENFITGDIKKFVWAYPDGMDFYISDAGVYFPSQYQKELVKRYKSFPCYMSLSRQISDSSVHFNAQVFSRVWDKIREHIEIGINCDKILYFPKFHIGRFYPFKRFKLCVQRVTIYDNMESLEAKREPFLVKPSLLASREKRNVIAMNKLDYIARFGHIKRMWLVYFNKSNYNTRRFKEILENGV